MKRLLRTRGHPLFATMIVVIFALVALMVMPSIVLAQAASASTNIPGTPGTATDQYLATAITDIQSGCMTPAERTNGMAGQGQIARTPISGETLVLATRESQTFTAMIAPYLVVAAQIAQQENVANNGIQVGNTEPTATASLPESMLNAPVSSDVTANIRGSTSSSNMMETNASIENAGITATTSRPSPMTLVVLNNTYAFGIEIIVASYDTRGPAHASSLMVADTDDVAYNARSGIRRAADVMMTTAS